MTSVNGDSRSGTSWISGSSRAASQDRDPSPAKMRIRDFRKAALGIAEKTRLLRGHANRAVKADGFAVEHIVFNDVLHQRREFRRLA
jgi:hypothetical protein